MKRAIYVGCEQREENGNFLSFGVTGAAGRTLQEDKTFFFWSDSNESGKAQPNHDNVYGNPCRVAEQDLYFPES